MRKLLSILGTITIASSSITALGLQYGNKVQSSILKRIKNYTDVSSLLARATILSQEENSQTGGRGFSLDYASSYIDSRNIGDFFPSEASLAGAPKDTKSRILLGSMFDYSNSGQIFIPQLKDSNLVLNPDPKVGKTGNSELINTFGVISSVLQILLGNDFNEGLAPMIYGLLNSSAVTGAGASIKDSLPDIGKNYLKNPATSNWIFDELGDIWSEDDLITASGKAFTELTFDDVFKVRQNNFWMGLSRILFSGYGADWKSTDDAIKSASTSQEKALKAIPTEGQDFNVVPNGILIEGIFHLIKYFRTLGVYYERILSQAVDYNKITGRNHLFDNQKVNGVWLSERISAVATEAYAPSANIVANTSNDKQKISIWSEEKINGESKYYQLINFQSLIQFFTKLFVVDRTNDHQSLVTQQALAILLGIPLAKEDATIKNPNVNNPFADVILAPALNAIGDYLGQRVDIDILGSTVHIEGLGGLLSQIIGILRSVLADGTPMWNNLAMTNDANVKVGILGGLSIVEIKAEDKDAPFSFATYLSTLLTRIKNSALIKLAPEDIKAMVNKIYDVGMQFVAKINQERSENPAYEKQNFGNPFRGLMDGELLASIYDLIDGTGFIEIPGAVRKVIPNLNTLFTTKLGEVLGAFNVAGEDWPIYLYGLRNKTISEVVETIGNQFETNRYKKLEDNQDYLFNARAAERMLKPLANNAVKIEFKGEVPESIKDLIDANGQTNLVFAALVALTYEQDIKTITIDGKSTNEAFLSFVLGITTTADGGYIYREGSFFYGLMLLYGYRNTEEPPALRTTSKITLQKIVNALTILINWMREKSIPEYVDQYFTPYFVKGWKTKYVSSEGVNQPNVHAFIEYDLIKTQNKKSITYRVRLERNAWNPDDNPQPWFDYGVWSLYSINKLN